MNFYMETPTRHRRIGASDPPPLLVKKLERILKQHATHNDNFNTDLKRDPPLLFATPLRHIYGPVDYCVSTNISPNSIKKIRKIYCVLRPHRDPDP